MNRQSWRAFGAALAAAALVPATATANPPVSWTAVPAATPKLAGTSSPNVLSPQLSEHAVGWGALPLDGGTAAVPFYGYDGFAAPTVLTQSIDEAHKTEPDKNTYLVLPRGQAGADAGYDYGTHFLFQGHESGTPGAITRINLDADLAHRVTLLATTDAGGKALPDIDGSTWDPFARRLLFTAENGNKGGVWAATLGYPSQVVDISGAIGRGGYEGIETDSDGNLWIVEDSGGKAGTANPHAKQPNSFLYRFVPNDPGDLSGGRLQVLQVSSQRSGQPIVFHAGQADADIVNPDTLDLHTPGAEFKTRWVTIHDTRTDGATPFDANALAKAAGATPFKRPENGVFQPGSHFRRFVFTETGDTNALTEAGAAYGGFGSLQELSQRRPSSDTGVLRVVYQGDVTHTGFDNITFVSRDQAAVVEDAGDALHSQRNALDSGYLLNVTQDQPTPVRFLAEGRDPSATFDAEHVTGNEGDNEITGIHVSDGDPSVRGLFGDDVPFLFRRGWRMFWTQQHGDNATYEVSPSR